MGGQQLSARRVRRIAEVTGLPVIRAVSFGVHYVYGFVTADHQHGWIDEKHDDWELEDNPRHWTSCQEFNKGTPNH